GLVDRCEIQLSYAIGVAEPTSISINTFNTNKIPDEQMIKLIREHFDLRPRGIVKMLNLLRPIYSKTAAYGHFGRSEPEFTWEATANVSVRQKDAQLITAPEGDSPAGAVATTMPRQCSRFFFAAGSP